MPGGTSRALRMIPAMVDIAEDVLDLAHPTASTNALFFNYSNPMAPVCRAIRKATGAEVVGLCHGVMHVGQWLAERLGVGVERLRYNAVGMNHLTWFNEVRVDGVDAMPRLTEIARDTLAGLPSQDHHDPALRGADLPLREIQPFSWQLLLRFGAFPACMDRHVTEFFGPFFREGAYYGRTLGVDAYSFEDTIARGDEIYAQMREDATSPHPLDEAYFRRIGGEHEQVVEIIDSVRRDAGHVYSVNLPNAGQVPNLPLEAIIEAPGVADGAGVRHIAQPPLSPGLVGTLATRLAWVETVVEAALEGSREKFVQALILDGAVPSMAVAERLADDLLLAQAQYLPQFTTS